MADRYLLESGGTDGYLLEDGSGVLLIDEPLKQNTFEGGSDGTTITVANSGGGSGDAFDTIATPGTGTTNAYETDGALVGSLGAKIQTTTTAEAAVLRWNFSPTFQQLYFRAYVNFGVVPLVSAAAAVFLRVTDSAGTNLVRVQMVADGSLRVFAEETIWQDFATVLATGTWYRFEVFVDIAADTMTFRRYAGHSTSAAENHTEAFAFALADIGRIQFGLPNNTANYGPVYFDDVGYRTRDWMGPTGVEGTTSKLVSIASSL